MKNHYKPYTEQELQFIRDNFPTVKTQAIAKALARSVDSIRHKARELGIKRTPAQARELKRGNSGAFRKGEPAWNKREDGYMAWRQGGWLQKQHSGKFRTYARVMWEKNFGKIPEGHVIRISLPKEAVKADWRNITPESLSCRHRKEVLAENQDYEKSSLTHLRKVWDDQYIAKKLAANTDGLEWQDVMGTRLIALKRAQILLNRKIKSHKDGRSNQESIE